jgi:hypothetical protein
MHGYVYTYPDPDAGATAGEIVAGISRSGTCSAGQVSALKH